MNKRQCLKQHTLDGICSYGKEGKLFGWMVHEQYCPVCRKACRKRMFWLNIRLPKINKDGLPF